MLTLNIVAVGIVVVTVALTIRQALVMTGGGGG